MALVQLVAMLVWLGPSMRLRLLRTRRLPLQLVRGVLLLLSSVLFVSALRELSRRRPGPGFRVLYGVNAERETALFVLGERLDRSFYGDSVRRAERMWKQFLEGTLRAIEPAQLR